MKYIIILVALLIGIAGTSIHEEAGVLDGLSVYKLNTMLGEYDTENLPDLSVGNVSAEVGEDLVRNGFSKRKGNKKAKRVSKHFVCTSCHNLEREDIDLRISDPQARLEYTSNNNLPFLQGTTLYGAVNREAFYNGYYIEKYKDLVWPARDNIREAIQLCAQECAQGRKLKDWELESILAYLWKIGLKVDDLNLTADERTEIEFLIGSGKKSSDAVQLIKSKYLGGSPATFVEPPEDRKVGYDLTGDPSNGKMIYDNSCLHCHEDMRYSYFNMNHSKMNLNYLRKKAGTYSRHSLYQVIRHGTFPKHGKKSYMPLYTKEKMSNQQVEDLRAYLEQG